MAEKTYPMTLAEKEKLELELEELKLVRRPEVVERIKIARSYGDLSENSEYEAAKDEPAFQPGGQPQHPCSHLSGTAGAYPCRAHQGRRRGPAEPGPHPPQKQGGFRP